ncbi:hypothetical protein QR98_0077750 [Sarcoptes scabiei]|uniref:Uncharacterized protein n=1 Tax=Sarcoptes scabiei TaxID=52283 RepID=A0A132AE32_SARSC|nr:hypothetical protein QR98_0077750 [Sarcoptes scabiei]
MSRDLREAEIDDRQKPAMIFNRKKIRWKYVERRNPKSIVYRSSSPSSAKNELRKFVQQNHLQYRCRPGIDKNPLNDFESFFDRLNLNDDEDLLERADRRDLPARFQSNHRWQTQASASTNRNDLKDLSFRSRTSMSRRSAMPNIIDDDLANRSVFRNHLKSSKSYEPWSHHSICYMWLENYPCRTRTENNRNDDRTQSIETNNDGEPHLVNDDVFNRRLKQSTAAKLPMPSLPFGIPTMPIISFVSNDYSKIDATWKSNRKLRFRSRESSPDLLLDDFAFRNLRKNSIQPSASLDGFNNDCYGRQIFSSTSLLLDEMSIVSLQ